MKRQLIIVFICLFLALLFIGCQAEAKSSNLPQSNTMTNSDVIQIGKLYSQEGFLYYEGDLKNGNPHGRGKAYDNSGKLFYEGTFIDGKVDQNGYVKTYWSNGKLNFQGYLKDGIRLEGEVFNEDGSVMGYIPYPPISIIGTWIGTMDKNYNLYELKFSEDGIVISMNSEFEGTYKFENYDNKTGKANIILQEKNKSEYSSGTIKFINKNLFIITNKFGEMPTYVRKGTNGY